MCPGSYSIVNRSRRRKPPQTSAPTRKKTLSIKQRKFIDGKLRGRSSSDAAREWNLVLAKWFVGGQGSWEGPVIRSTNPIALVCSGQLRSDCNYYRSSCRVLPGSAFGNSLRIRKHRTPEPTTNPQVKGSNPLGRIPTSLVQLECLMN